MPSRIKGSVSHKGAKVNHVPLFDAHGQGQAKQDQRKRGSTIMPEPDTTGGSLLVPSLADHDAIEIGQAIRRGHGRGAGKPRVLRDIHPSAAAAPLLRRTVSQGFPTASRMAGDAPHRRATRVLAESLGKPSL